jgi:CheY-like chemotaxis protein
LPKQLSAKNKSLRLIALSGNAMPEDIEQSQNAGFAEHLVKPVVLDKLLSAIARIVS